MTPKYLISIGVYVYGCWDHRPSATPKFNVARRQWKHGSGLGMRLVECHISSRNPVISSHDLKTINGLKRHLEGIKFTSFLSGHVPQILLKVCCYAQSLPPPTHFIIMQPLYKWDIMLICIGCWGCICTLACSAVFFTFRRIPRICPAPLCMQGLGKSGEGAYMRDHYISVA